jgi:hypothetical protein
MSVGIHSSANIRILIGCSGPWGYDDLSGAGRTRVPTFGIGGPEIPLQFGACSRRRYLDEAKSRQEYRCLKCSVLHRNIARSPQKLIDS